jgi:hypothetical protein
MIKRLKRNKGADEAGFVAELLHNARATFLVFLFFFVSQFQ